MTDTRTSEALSDDTYAVESVSWLRKTAAHHDAGVGMHTKYGAKLTAIANSLESKDRAYADLSHLCANYKAEIERLTFHKADVDATNERLRQEVIPLQKRLALKDDKLDKARARIRQLEALVGEAVRFDDGAGEWAGEALHNTTSSPTG